MSEIGDELQEGHDPEKLKPAASKQTLPPFLSKLRQITSSSPREIGEWTEDGSIYLVHSTKEFEETVLKEHFKGNVSSFIRQLHFYGFKKLDHPKNKLGFSFSHPYFHREKPHLIFVIKRKTKNDDLGEDAVFTAADLKVFSTQLEDLKREAEELRKEVDNIKATKRIKLNSVTLSSISTEKLIEEALEEIEDEVLKPKV